MKTSIKCSACGEINECEMCDFFIENDCGFQSHCIRPDDRACCCENCGNQLRKSKNDRAKQKMDGYTPIFEKTIDGDLVTLRVMMADHSWRDIIRIELSRFPELDIIEKIIVQAFNHGFISYKMLITETQVMYPNFLLSRNSFKLVKR